ncbi:MAG: PorV/PorQ family protein [Candidatus Desantisbacteria bacterium]
MKKLLLSLIILLIGLPSISWGDGACTTAMPFLKMGMGVRATAMGKAFCAVADDSSAMYWNPAGLGQIKSGQIGIEYTKWFEDVAYTSVSGVYPLRKAAIGGFANMLLTDESQVTTDAQPKGTGKTFRETNGIFGVAGGIPLTNHISCGATGKVFLQKIGDEDAIGFAGDMGFLCKMRHAGLGLSLQNIGTKMKFIGKGFALPATIRAGLAGTPFTWLTISGEVANILPEKKTVVYAGLECQIADVIALRGGYDSENGHGLTAGFGARLKNVQMDYAYVPYEKFEATHRIAASVRFGNKPEAEETVQEIIDRTDRSNSVTPQSEQTPTPASAPALAPPTVPIPPVSTHPPASNQPPKQIRTVITVAKNTPIFSGPGRTYSLITTVPVGVELILVDDSKKWYYQVKLPDGSLGWVPYVCVQK